MKKGRTKQNTIRYSTGVAASNLWQKLVVDFREHEGESFAVEADKAFSKGIAEYRGYKYPELGYINPQRFRRWKQLEALLSKFIFTKDAYTEQERETLSVDGYLADQQRISQALPLKFSGHLVLKEARKITRAILGDFSNEGVLEHVKFGKKSSIGCSLAKAHIDVKLSDVGAFTSSSQCWRWFNEYILSEDKILCDLVEKHSLLSQPDLRQLDYLKLVCVPKKWNIDRVITPMPLLDLFYSYGIAGVVTERLRDVGLDIRSLQHKHRYLVKGFSLNRTHVTADLSSASDSITPELLCRILPRAWYVALKPLFKRKIVYNGKEFYTSSVLPMGNGATFPLETLIFYVLIKAIGNLAGVKGIYSVYGDDLIYPRRLHKYVADVFPQLHLILNLNKTFVNAPFRESCGSDYYRGVDVRPFYLKGEDQQLTSRSYQAFCYKALNGLLARWEPSEIPRATAFLLHEIAKVAPICVVPPSFPDDSGLKVEDPHRNLVPWYLPHIPVRCLFSNGSAWFSFMCLRGMPKDRHVLVQEPYYWLALQGRTDVKDENFWDTDYSVFRDIASRQPLRWNTVTYRKHFVGANGKHMRRTVVKYKAVVDARLGTTTTLATERISAWFGSTTQS